MTGKKSENTHDTAHEEDARQEGADQLQSTDQPHDDAPLFMSYDNIYKYFLSNPVVFYYFIKYFVPEKLVANISPDNIHEEKTDFITDEFKNREADVIYKVRFRGRDIYFYIMIELQSTVDKTIPARLLTYIILFYDNKIRSSQKGKLPAVFPIILYTGEKKWHLPLNFQDFIEPTLPKQYIPSFEYCLIEGNKYSREDLLKIKGTMAAVLYATRQDSKTFHENCAKMVETIAPMLEVTDKKQVAMFARWFTWSFGNRVNVLTMKAVKAMKKLKEVKGVLATAVELLKKEVKAEGLERGLERGLKKGRQEGQQEGLERGLKKGRQEGEQEGLRKAAKAMLEKGFNEDSIRAVTDLSIEEIRGLARTMPN